MDLSKTGKWLIGFGIIYNYKNGKAKKSRLNNKVKRYKNEGES